MKKWERFEKLTHQIFSELHPDAQVKWDDAIQGVQSGAERQIDISIRAKSGGEDILVIIQAKDIQSVADIKIVDGFASVIKDVEATKGILVCRSGFTKKAKEYAKNLGIELINMHDAESRDWRREIKIPIIWVDLRPRVELQLLVHLNAGDSIHYDDKGYCLSTDYGKTRINPVSTFERLWNDGKISRNPMITHTIITQQRMKVLVSRSGENIWSNIKRFQLQYSIIREAWLGYFSPERCRGIIDYLQDETFTASFLPIEQIPYKKSSDWTKIEDPEQVMIHSRGTLVTSSSYILLQPGSGKMVNMKFAKLD